MGTSKSKLVLSDSGAYKNAGQVLSQKYMVSIFFNLIFTCKLINNINLRLLGLHEIGRLHDGVIRLQLPEFIWFFLLYLFPSEV